MQYTISEINNGVAKISFSDGTWTFVELTSDMSEADLDDYVYAIRPPHLKTGSTPSFASAGSTRTAAEKPTPADTTPMWEVARKMAYGSVEQQIEYITENGLDAWQTKVTQIKTDNPKS